MKRIGKVHKCSFLVTADVVGLYSSRHTTKEGILVLKNQLEEQTSSNIPMIWLSWHNLFSKTFSLNLTTKLSSKSLVVLLELNLLLHTPTIIWIKLRQIFLKRSSFSHFYGWDILGTWRSKTWKVYEGTFCNIFYDHSIYMQVTEKKNCIFRS